MAGFLRPGQIAGGLAQPGFGGQMDERQLMMMLGLLGGQAPQLLDKGGNAGSAFALGGVGPLLRKLFA